MVRFSDLLFDCQALMEHSKIIFDIIIFSIFKGAFL